MRRLLFILLSISIICCKQDKKETISLNREESMSSREIPDEVVISLADSIETCFFNVFVSDFQDKPDILYLGTKHKKLSITIPTNNFVIISMVYPGEFHYKMKFYKGDSVKVKFKTITNQHLRPVDYPIHDITNKEINPNESNFEYLLYKKNIYAKAKGDKDLKYTNAINLLVSLKAEKEISDDFYDMQMLNEKHILAISKVRSADYNDQKINLDSLGIDLENQSLFENSNYIDLLKSVVLYKYFSNRIERIPNSVLFDCILNNNTFLQDSLREAVLYSYLIGTFYAEKNRFEDYRKKYEQMNKNDFFKERLELAFKSKDKRKSKLHVYGDSIGVLSNLMNDNQTNFDELMTQVKGKIVLVDFWASWCGPCRAEMPHLKVLKNSFDSSNFIVIEISVDSNYEAWERASKIENIETYKHNYIISNWKESSLYINHKIETIPRYLLFDENGNIIDDDAPRPTSKELKKLIEKNINNVSI